MRWIYPKPVSYPVSAYNQRGVVLILVVMVVVIMLVLLAFMVEQQHISIRRIANQKVAEQGYQYAQGVNEWAARVLNDDQNRVVDYLDEDWAKFGRPEEDDSAETEREAFSLDRSSQDEDEDEELPTIDFGFDGLEYQIDDLQGKFNLNNLGIKEFNPELLPGQKRIFINLLEILEVGEFDERERLAAALVDWIDENDLTEPNGTESGSYKVKKTPYHAADQKLTSIGELRFVEGFTEEIINKLKPFVTVLPVTNARVNLNTVSPEVLASLSSGPVTDIGQVVAFLVEREDPAFLGFQQGAIQAAESAIIGVSVVNAQAVPNMLQVNSQFFQVNAKVDLGDFVYCMRSVMLRENANPDGLTAPKVSVLSRQHDTLCSEEAPTVDPDSEQDADNEDEDLS